MSCSDNSRDPIGDNCIARVRLAQPPCQARPRLLHAPRRHPQICSRSCASSAHDLAESTPPGRSCLRASDSPPRARNRSQPSLKPLPSALLRRSRGSQGLVSLLTHLTLGKHQCSLVRKHTEPGCNQGLELPLLGTEQTNRTMGQVQSDQNQRGSQVSESACNHSSHFCVTLQLLSVLSTRVTGTLNGITSIETYHTSLGLRPVRPPGPCCISSGYPAIQIPTRARQIRITIEMQTLSDQDCFTLPFSYLWYLYALHTPIF